MRYTKLGAASFIVLMSQISCTTQAQSQGLATLEETKAVCASAAESFSGGDVDKTIQVLAPHWPLPKAELDASAYQTKTQLDMISSRFGDPVGAEFIRTTEAGQSFARHKFAIKYEKHAVRFSCLFYKPRDRWVVNAFTWDDKPMIAMDD